MLAIRDQENLVHGQQTAAASKALNQGSKQLNPKTPGNKAPKTPFKIPLNDENDRNFLGAKSMKGVGKGGENLQTGGKKSAFADKNAFITPLGPRSRAPLGQKTTNAKAKGLQTPGPDALDNDLGKTAQRSATSRKAKPRMSHAETVKVDVLADNDLEEREIEYMPPPAKNLPDTPDDLPDLNLSMFNGEFTRNCLGQYLTQPGPDGISIFEKREKENQERWDRQHAREEAMIMRDIENMPLQCIHSPECLGDECKDEPERRRQHEAKWAKIIASLPETYPSLSVSSKAAASKPKSMKKPTAGPPTIKSKAAASALSLPVSPPRSERPAKQPARPAARAFPVSILGANRDSKKAAPLPTNPSPMRHAAAVRASNTTIGYSKGRTASATLRKTVLPLREAKDNTTTTSNSRQSQPQKQVQQKQRLAASGTRVAAIKPVVSQTPDLALAPALYIQEYGIPPFGSEMWLRCKRYGCFDEDGENGEGNGLEDDWSSAERKLQDLLRADAEEEFELPMP